MEEENFKTVRYSDAPDHIVEEVNELAREMCGFLRQTNISSPHVILNAVIIFYAHIVVASIVNNPEALKRTADASYCTLIKNIEGLSGIKISDER